MTASDPRVQSVIDLFSRVKAGWPAARWEWDGRFGCALSTLGGADEAKAREALQAGLPAAWSGATMAQAPEAVKRICGSTGGLRGGQMAFSAELPDGTVAYCLWWPWGGGGNISARIGVVAKDAADLNAAVKTAFGLG
jgi:hypothetical protein